MLVVTEHIQDIANMVVQVLIPEQNHDHNLAVADLKTHSVPVLVLAETLDTDCSLIHFEVESLVARFYVAQFAWWSWVILAIMMRSVEGCFAFDLFLGGWFVFLPQPEGIPNIMALL